MSLASMTGFARSSGLAQAGLWAWEIKTVNARGLDLRLRVPPGFDELEMQARAAIARHLARGACNASLSLQRETAPVQARINLGLLASLTQALRTLPAGHGLAPASLDAVLAIRGVVEITEPSESEAARLQAAREFLAGLEVALGALVQNRRREGSALGEILWKRLANIIRLVDAAERCPGRQPAVIRARLADAISGLMAAASALDPARLHQEAVILAARADVREELDRLRTHVAAVEALLADGRAVGRRLDFLAQELGREANTLSAKSADAGLTAIGLELRVEIEQMREQIQNIE